MIVNSLKNSRHERTYSVGGVYLARLIEVGEEGDLSYRLVETHSHPKFVQPSLVSYAALSYCWGPQENAALQFKTERHSLEYRLSGFQVDQVTPILRDAIQTTRALKIPYLWVDAVCIVQDDEEYWDKESSRMIFVYRNAALAIFTPASASCQQGVLARDWAMTRIKFRSRLDKTVSGSYILRSVGEELAFGRFHPYGDCLYFALMFTRWARRGWTLQEYELSQRALVFGRTKLHTLTDSGARSEGSDQFSIPTRHWYLLWLIIVGRYSGCELSNPSDKLPAISGLAKHILPSSLPNYYAGHIFLHIDLYWVSFGLWPGYSKTKEALLHTLQFQDSYVTPSWSWASRSHTINFGEWFFFDIGKFDMSWCNVKEECEIVKVSVSLAGSDLFGKVRGGSLLIRGAVVPLPPKVELLGDVGWHEKQWQANDDDKDVAYLSFDWGQFRDDESFEMMSLVLLGCCNMGVNKSWKPFDGTGLYKAEISDTSGSRHNEAYAHPLTKAAELGKNAEVIRLPSVPKDERHAYGIIIHPTSIPEKYLRVGVFYSVAVEGGGLKYFHKRPTQTVEII
ncbi:heterokaryon incompatibility protein-domain-containing protein [Hypoxylon rubiginosum]|uniref:Heterokaryon incompatibility protein-domain-containing protein n=1 Tax=Hypoxylon rubiginosum TaxID=110542 RepID=A0ACB9ZG23_9PEZI|nr:heterokaryon incompatibility protein-domain-containing protein [Hypoxylon rubiginosum]